MKANDDKVHVPVSDNFEPTLTEKSQVVYALLYKMVLEFFLNEPNNEKFDLNLL
jgi:hypothetical protein